MPRLVIAEIAHGEEEAPYLVGCRARPDPVGQDGHVTRHRPQVAGLAESVGEDQDRSPVMGRDLGQAGDLNDLHAVT